MKRYALGLAFLAGALVALLFEHVLRPEPVCAEVIAVPYKTGLRPVCMIVNTTKENP